MGFEITYHFFPRKEEGAGYDTEAPQTFVKQMGKLEEVPVEKLASAVMMQLARRDIMVFDVEISEYIKRKVSFKETKGGVLIKNKKFMLDGTVEVMSDCGEGGEDEVAMPSYLDPAAAQAPQKPVQFDKPANHPIRYEVFDPDVPLIGMLQKKFRLTPKRKYPILEEKTVIQRINVNGNMTEMPGYEYVVIDDEGKKLRVPSMHFVPEQRGLIGMDPYSMQQRNDGPRLSYMDQYSDPGMPTLRR